MYIVWLFFHKTPTAAPCSSMSLGREDRLARQLHLTPTQTRRRQRAIVTIEVGSMDVEHKRSLVAWANTFGSADETACAATSLADFASGELLVHISRVIVGYNDNTDSDNCADKSNVGSSSSWAEVFFRMKTVDLLEQDADIPGAEADEEKLTFWAVTCLEALLRHTVCEQCFDRETFIRQIMSLDASAQTTLRYIIIGHSNDGGNSEACSPPRESSVEGSVLGSPMPSAYSLDSPAFDRSVVGCEGGGDLSAFKSLFSPQEGEDAREARSAGSLGGEDRAAAVGPKRRHARLNLDMETGKDAASVAASAGSLPVVVGGGATVLTAAEVRCDQVKRTCRSFRAASVPWLLAGVVMSRN